jgi:uncharacterized membrane protein
VSERPSTEKSARLVGIDLARGLAVLLMIQTHAYDGWVSASLPGGKSGLGWFLSRSVSNVPAPLFLLLAGVGLELGGQAAQRRGQPPQTVRKALLLRGLEVLFYGYLVSAIYSMIEWKFDVKGLLRADILHCIGLSLVVCTGLVVLRSATRGRAILLSAVALFGGLLLSRFVPAAALPSFVRPLVGLVVDVPEYTRFPLLPLVGFCAVGMAVAPSLVAAEKRQKPWHCLGAAAVLVVLALVCGALTHKTVAQLGGRLSRSHPAVIWNFLDGTCRALAAAAVGLFLAGTLREGSTIVAVLTRLGRGSLLAYAVHIPLCYGRLATPIAGQLSMAQATPLVVGLMILTFAVVVLRDRLANARRARS